MAGKLTIRQDKFAQGLFAGLTQPEAYRQAFNAGNMKPETVVKRAFEYSKKPQVLARIKELTDELKERNMITVERVLEQLGKIAFADIKDILSFKTVKIINEEATAIVGFPVFSYKTVIDLKDSSEVDGTLIAEVSETRDGFKVKRNDQMKALELIGKHLGMFTDKMELTGKDGGPIEVDSPRERIERRIAGLASRIGTPENTGGTDVGGSNTP